MVILKDGKRLTQLPNRQRVNLFCQSRLTFGEMLDYSPCFLFQVPDQSTSAATVRSTEENGVREKRLKLVENIQRSQVRNKAL